MGLTMNEKKAVAREVAKRYQKASKKQRGLILKEFIALTECHRTVLRTNNDDLTSEEIVKAYKQLIKVERESRCLKDTLEIMSVYPIRFCTLYHFEG